MVEVHFDPFLEATDPVFWAKVRTGFVADSWQERFLRSVANPPRDNAGNLRNSHTLNSPRQCGKSTVLGLLGAFWADTKRPVTITRIPGQPDIRRVRYDKAPTVAYFAASQRQAESTLRIARDFLVAAGINFDQSATDKLTTERGARVLALPATATARGETLSLVMIDEAGHLENGGEDVVGVVTPMMSSFSSDSSALVMSSTPGVASGLFFRHVTQPEDMKTNLTQVCLNDNPRISQSFLEAEKARMGPLYYSSEYGNDPAKPPEFWQDGRGLFSMTALRAAVTEKVQALEIDDAWG